MRELYVRACVSNEHFHLPLPGTRCTFFPLLARGLIPRLIAHAEQTIFFFYYSISASVSVCFVSIKFPARVGRPWWCGQKIRRNWTMKNQMLRISEKIRRSSYLALEMLTWTKNLWYPIGIRTLEVLILSYIIRVVFFFNIIIRLRYFTSQHFISIFTVHFDDL